MRCAGGKRRRGKRPSKKKRKAAGKDKDDDWDGEALVSLQRFCAGGDNGTFGVVSWLARTRTGTGTVVHMLVRHACCFFATGLGG
jgi:hypothetical protein